MNKMNAKEQEKAEAIDRLKEWLKPGGTVYTVLRRVSASGMTRHISVIFPQVEDGKIRMSDLTWNVGKALGRKFDRDTQGLVVQGCGMDMGFEVVYSLGCKLFPDGFKVEGRGRNGDTSGWDKDGGYALEHRWI